jgi:hypothetical protein
LQLDPKIYSQIIQDKRISHGAFRVWHLLRDMTGDNTHCWPSMRTICKKISCSKSSVSGWIKELIEAQYVTVKRGSRHSPNRYFVSGIVSNLSVSEGYHRGIVSGTELNSKNINSNNQLASSMENPQDKNVQDFHHCYRQSTGLDVSLNFYRESMWREWFRYGETHCGGFTQDDLRAVVELRKFRAKNKMQGYHTLAFNALIGSPDVMEEDLSEARAKSRQRKPSARDAILRATGRPTEPTRAAVTAGNVIEGERAFQAFRQWRAENNL